MCCVCVLCDVHGCVHFVRVRFVCVCLCVVCCVCFMSGVVCVVYLVCACTCASVCVLCFVCPVSAGVFACVCVLVCVLITFPYLCTKRLLVRLPVQFPKSAGRMFVFCTSLVEKPFWGYTILIGARRDGG